jgi:chloramphenicol 3-O phosphotransferase
LISLTSAGPHKPGQIVVLNGAPRSGKTSIAKAIADVFDEPWLNIGVDAWMRITPEHLHPGIGLRPGGERPDLEPLIKLLYGGLYEAVAAQSRCGLNVVVDVGHHDSYSRRLTILRDCARRLTGLPVLFVGVRCPLEVILKRRLESRSGGGGTYLTGSLADPPAPVLLWQSEVHKPGIYDLEVDSSASSPVECAEEIRLRLRSGVGTPAAFARLAEMA